MKIRGSKRIWSWAASEAQEGWGSEAADSEALVEEAGPQADSEATAAAVALAAEASGGRGKEASEHEEVDPAAEGM